jgi:hypothetical protein
MRSTRLILSTVLLIVMAGWIVADSDDDKGGHDDHEHGHTHDGGGAGGGVTIDLNSMTRDKKEPDPFGEPPKTGSKPPDTTNVDIPHDTRTPTEPPRLYVDNGDEEKKCHCEAARMIVISCTLPDIKNPEGPKTDPTMAATLKWVRTLHLHKLRVVVYYSARPDDSLQLDHPMELVDTKPNAPPAADGTKTDATRWVWQQVDAKTLTDSWTDCCYYEEVLLFMHGSKNAFPDVIKVLPKLLGGRPVKKLIAWSCKSTKKFAPVHGADFDIYSQLCAIVAPKDCPCGCDPSKCITVDEDHCPNAPKAFCPSKTTPVEVQAAWYYAYSQNGMVLAVPLGIDPADKNQSPFTTPDGNVREIHIDPDPANPGSFNINVQPKPSGTGTEIFACKKVKPDVRLLNAYIPPKDASEDEIEAAKQARIDNGFRPETILKQVKIDDKLVKKSTIPFQGKNVCPKGDGCQPNPKTG